MTLGAIYSAKIVALPTLLLYSTDVHAYRAGWFRRGTGNTTGNTGHRDEEIGHGGSTGSNEAPTSTPASSSPETPSPPVNEAAVAVAASSSHETPSPPVNEAPAAKPSRSATFLNWFARTPAPPLHPILAEHDPQLNCPCCITDSRTIENAADRRKFCRDFRFCGPGQARHGVCSTCAPMLGPNPKCPSCSTPFEALRSIFFFRLV